MQPNNQIVLCILSFVWLFRNRLFAVLPIPSELQAQLEGLLGKSKRRQERGSKREEVTGKSKERLGLREAREGGVGTRKEAGVNVGCCGFAVAQKKYFELFKVIEIQQAFYHLPEIKTAEKWRDAAPPGFEFTMKAWQLITRVPSNPTYRRPRERIDPARADRYGGFRLSLSPFL